MHHFDVITPKLINNNIIEDNPNIIPVVTSCNGVPGNGFKPSNTNNPQQFSNENTVTSM